MTWKPNQFTRSATAIDRRALGDRLRRLRQERRWTVVALAERAEVQPWVIHRCESGKSNTQLENLVPLARTLGVTLDHLVQGEPSPPKTPDERREMAEDVARALEDLPSFAFLSSILYEALARLGRDARTCRQRKERA